MTRRTSVPVLGRRAMRSHHRAGDCERAGCGGQRKRCTLQDGGCNPPAERRFRRIRKDGGLAAPKEEAR